MYNFSVHFVTHFCHTASSLIYSNLLSLALSHSNSTFFLTFVSTFSLHFLLSLSTSQTTSLSNCNLLLINLTFLFYFLSELSLSIFLFYFLIYFSIHSLLTLPSLSNFPLLFFILVSLSTISILLYSNFSLYLYSSFSFQFLFIWEGNKLSERITISCHFNLLPTRRIKS